MKRVVWMASLGLILGCPADDGGTLPVFTASGTSDVDDDDDDSNNDDDSNSDDDANNDEDDQSETTDDEDDGQGETQDGTTGSASDSQDDDSETASDSDTTGEPDSDTADSQTGGDPNCYSEPLDKNADVEAILAGYGGADWKDDLIAAMAARWPAGAWLLDEQRNDSYFNQFSDSSSWPGMVGWLDTLVHEQTHLFNGYHAGSVGEAHALYFREDLILYLPQDTGFARSEIMGELTPELASSTYASTYLTGSQGERGFNPLLDELLAYENEVPAMSVFGSYYNGGVSLRDGSAAFLVFLEMYLRVGRNNHSAWYESAKANPQYVEAVLLSWQRLHFFYDEVGDDFPNLGISDDVYRAVAYEEANIAEIEMFVGADLDASPCINQ